MSKLTVIERALDHLGALGVGETLSSTVSKKVEGVLIREHARLVGGNSKITWDIDTIPDPCIEAYAFLVASLLTTPFKAPDKAAALIFQGASNAENVICAHADTAWDGEPVKSEYF